MTYPTADPSTSAAKKRRAAFAAAGLPVPLYTAKAPGRHDSDEWDTRIGILTHKVIGQVAAVAQWHSRDEQAALVRATVAEVVTDRTLGRLDRARTRVTGLTTQYLREFLPPASADFLGTELPAGAGRVDLAWRHPSVGVWFDELKTWRHSQVGLYDATWKQVNRYLDAGRTTFGSNFAGLRLLTLGNLRACVTITPAGLIEDLAESGLHPSRLALGDVA